MNEELYYGCCEVSLVTGRCSIAPWFPIFQVSLIMILWLTPVPFPHVLQPFHILIFNHVLLQMLWEYFFFFLKTTKKLPSSFVIVIGR